MLCFGTTINNTPSKVWNHHTYFRNIIPDYIIIILYYIFPFQSYLIVFLNKSHIFPNFKGPVGASGSPGFPGPQGNGGPEGEVGSPGQKGESVSYKYLW